jgi:hypothetical protein
MCTFFIHTAKESAINYRGTSINYTQYNIRRDSLKNMRKGSFENAVRKGAPKNESDKGYSLEQNKLSYERHSINKG